MDQLIGDFSNHLSKALEIGNSTTFKKPRSPISSVLICGLGGSGIGGTIISQLLKFDCRVPIVVNKDYFIPEFVNSTTLVICCSYSGNTEETLSMYEAAKKKNPEICVISSGGRFAEIAKNETLNFLQIPGGFPPRAAFGLSFPQLIFVFEKYGLITDKHLKSISAAIALINEESDNIKKEANAISQKLFNKIPVIYSESNYEGVSTRFRQQINENSKVLCWHHSVPELNHNELVGWRNENQSLALVIFRSKEEYYRNSERITYLKGIIEKYTNTVIEIIAKGNDSLVESLYLIHLGDWVSYFLAELKGVDSVEVDVITGLKNLLSKLD